MARGLMRLLILGFGYSAAAIAGELRGRAEWIGGTIRDESRSPELARAGVEPLIFGSSHASAALRHTTHILASIPPGEAGDPVLAQYAGQIRAAPELRWIGYLSTVGVYGDHGGAWVDEDTPPNPSQPRTIARVEAENAWRQLGRPLAIFRIAGIYGPGRNALVNLAEGTARRIVKPSQIFNRIHVEDIAAVVAAAATQDATGIFNLADDEPAPPQDVIAYAAELMGVAPPPEIDFAEAELSPMARSFYGENRRVANRRIKERLGIALRYPTYREGLTELWRSGSWR
jgi:nucleoside-diphosphate-sugar epimerase